MSIKLICSDIDGTLLQYGKKELEDEIFEQIRELHRRGILFCPASGWQYTSLRKLFAPVADCCVFLCENGGVIYKDEQCIAKNPMPRALAEEIANDLWTRSDGQGAVMLSGQNTAYLMERGLGMLKRIQLANFKGVELHETEFYQCDLRKADFRDAAGCRVDILGSRLKDAKFSLPEAVNLLADLKIKLS
jgi:hydroxymethylpyrimidine pyrophosphatase-like HAD family hydrolase